jgi:thiol:disulfide interchange protein DsbD
VFPLPAVRAELQQFEKVKLYTDEMPDAAYTADPGYRARKREAGANQDFQNAVFRTIQLPLYAVLAPQPDGKVRVVGVYPEGAINDPAKFAAFLKESREKAKGK